MSILYELTASYYPIRIFQSFLTLVLSVIKSHTSINKNKMDAKTSIIINKGNTKITELRTILQMESQNS
jgi:uncharacterized membrane protein YcaP (DUF421 family)